MNSASATRPSAPWTARAALQQQAPESLQAVRGESVLSSATSPFFLPLLPAGMSEPQRALVNALSLGALGRESLHRLLLEWAASLNPGEPTERAKRDCLPLQELLRAGALRVFGRDRARCEAALAAAERLCAAQFAWVAEAAARSARRARTGVAGLAAFMSQWTPASPGQSEGRQMALLFSMRRDRPRRRRLGHWWATACATASARGCAARCCARKTCSASRGATSLPACWPRCRAPA